MLRYALLTVTLALGAAELCTDDVCEYHFDVRRVHTMMYYAPGSKISYSVMLDSTNNSLKIVPDTLRVPGSDALLGTYVSADNVIAAGGIERDVITVNGQFPGRVLR